MSLDLKSNNHQINLGVVKEHVGLSYEFESFRLDGEHLMLYRQDDEVSLTPKQVETLLALIEKKGEIVSKETLMSRLWGNCVVEEANLVQNIHILRKVLSNTAAGKPMIETFRRRGYRFNGEVRANGHANTLTKNGTAPTTDQAHIVDEAFSEKNGAVPRVGNKKLLAVMSLGALIIVILGSALLLSRSGQALSGNTRQFAVLPLKPIDVANRSDLYEVGIADALINRLNSIEGFIARPLSAMRQYDNVAQDPLAAGHEQKVDYVLAPNYQSADGKIRITTQLYNVSTGQVEEAYHFEKELSGVFAVQDSFAADLTNRLMIRFGSRSSGPVKQGTTNEEAYRLYLLASILGEERGVQKVLKSLEYLDRAVELDPNYALAWAAKARTHGDVVTLNDSGQHENYQKSMEAIGKARALDPNLSEVFSALCHNKNRYEYDAEGADEACRRAVELDPTSPVAHKTYANFLYTRGRFDEAIVEIRTAIDLQPVSFRNQQIYALTLYFARRYEEAEAQFKRLIELNPTHTYVYGRLVKVLDEQGKESEAYEYLISMLAVDRDDEKIERFKRVYGTSGWRGVLAEQIKIAEATGRPRNLQLACLYAKVGNKDKAFEQLETAYRERSYQIAILQVEPQLDSLRSDPRYADLVRRVEGK